jgi:hypothetical protein
MKNNSFSLAHPSSSLSALRGSLMKHSTLVLALLLSMSSVAAPPAGGSWKDVKVTDITAHPDGGPGGKGYVVVTFSSNGTGTPSCASGYPRNVAIDLSTAGGGFAAAVAQSSFLSDSAVTVTGTGACGVPTVETLASIREVARSPFQQ